MRKNLHAAELGRLGGSVSSAAKAEAARENARRPRPNAKGKKKPRTRRSADDPPTLSRKTPGP